MFLRPFNVLIIWSITNNIIFYSTQQQGHILVEAFKGVSFSKIPFPKSNKNNNNNNNNSNSPETKEKTKNSTPLLKMSSSSSSYTISEFKVLGVCGGIGSGKSSACKMLVSEFGCLAHLDADTIAHSVYTPGSQAIEDIVNGFGTDILQPNSKEIDRKKLGSIVFADRKEMAKLEQIVWPHVKTILKRRIEEVRVEWMAQRKEEATTTSSNDTGNDNENDNNNKQEAIPVVILEAAVLLDAGWDDLLDGIWVVTTSPSIALERLMETRGLSKEEAQKRIDAQSSRRGMGNTATNDDDIKAGIISSIIPNEGSLEDLKLALENALKDPKSWK